jgi:hypothetical protein
MVGVGVGDDRSRYPSPWIDIKVAGGTIEAVFVDCQQLLVHRAGLTAAIEHAVSYGR